MKKVMKYSTTSVAVAVAVGAVLSAFAYALFNAGETDMTWWYELTLPQAIVLFAVIVVFFGLGRKT